jgi:hypothetical protein
MSEVRTCDYCLRRRKLHRFSDAREGGRMCDTCAEEREEKKLTLEERVALLEDCILSLNERIAALESERERAHESPASPVAYSI